MEKSFVLEQITKIAKVVDSLRFDSIELIKLYEEHNLTPDKGVVAVAEKTKELQELLKIELKKAE